MKKPATEYVTLVEVFELTALSRSSKSAIDAVAERLEAEGVRELVSINFYGEPGSTGAGPSSSSPTVADAGAHGHGLLLGGVSRGSSAP